MDHYSPFRWIMFDKGSEPLQFAALVLQQWSSAWAGCWSQGKTTKSFGGWGEWVAKIQQSKQASTKTNVFKVFGKKRSVFLQQFAFFSPFFGGFMWFHPWNKVGNALGGVVFGDAPLPCPGHLSASPKGCVEGWIDRGTGPDGEAYFEVVVEELRQGEEILEKHREEEVEDMFRDFSVKLLVSCSQNQCRKKQLIRISLGIPQSLRCLIHSVADHEMPKPCKAMGNLKCCGWSQELTEVLVSGHITYRVHQQPNATPSCAGNDDGLVLGVASKKPQSMDDILMGCDVKASVWVKFDGGGARIGQMCLVI